MKKVLSILGILTVLCSSTPAFASPHGPGAPMQSPHHQGQVVRAGHHQMNYHHPAPPPPPANVVYHRPHNSVVVGGVLARRGYWGYPYCYDYRLGCCDGFYYRTYPRYHSGISVNFRF